MYANGSIVCSPELLFLSERLEANRGAFDCDARMRAGIRPVSGGGMILARHIQDFDMERQGIFSNNHSAQTHL
jgi:hypothetical protein